MMTEITCRELWDRIRRREPLVVVDTMPWPFYRHSHIAGAISLPYDRVVDIAQWIVPDKHMTTVVYCQSSECRYSDRVAEELEKLGYTKVAIYRGGKTEWRAAGLPMEYHKPPSGRNKISQSGKPDTPTDVTPKE